MECLKVQYMALILFVICVDDLADNLTIAHLLYADDVKLIAPRKHAAAFQSSLIASPKLSEDWELILNPSKSEQLPFGDTSNLVKYSLTSHIPSKAQPIHTASTVRDLGSVRICLCRYPYPHYFPPLVQSVYSHAS